MCGHRVGGWEGRRNWDRSIHTATCETDKQWVRTYPIAQGTPLSAPQWPRWEGNPKRGDVCVLTADSLRRTQTVNDVVKQLCDHSARDSLRLGRRPVSEWCGAPRWLRWNHLCPFAGEFPQEEPMLSASAPGSGTSWLSLAHSPPTPATPSCLPVLDLR